MHTKEKQVAPKFLHPRKRHELERGLKTKARERISRAWKAGLSANDVLTGRAPETVADAGIANLHNVYYIVLKSPNVQRPMMTTSKQKWRKAITDETRLPYAEAVFHAFASMKEVQAYCLAANIDIKEVTMQ